MYTPEQLLQYFNIGFIAFICFFALIGFIRGTYKSAYYLIVTLVVFVGGWLVSAPVSNWMMNYDLSTRNWSLMGIELTTLKGFVEALVSSKIAGSAALMTTDTMFSELVIALTYMATRLAFFIILVVLSFTIFKLIADIVWLFIKPSKAKDKKGRKKKTLPSRLGGMGIGAVKGALYMLLLILPIAGIASVTKSLEEVVQPSEVQYNLVFSGDKVTSVPVEENNNNQLKNVFDILGVYNDSLAGKLYSVGHVDQLLFDGLFQFEVGESKVKLRKELEIVASALKKAQINIGSNVGFDQLISKLLTEDPTLLEEIIDELSTLELINVIIPVGIEFILLKGDEAGNTLLDSLPVGLDINLEAISNIDFRNDFKKAGYAFIDVTKLINFDEMQAGGEIEYLNFDPAIVREIINSIAEMDITKEYSPVAVSYLVSQENIQSMFTELGFDIADLGLEDIENWDEEIKTFGNIYEAFYDLNIKGLSNLQDLDYSSINEEKINALTESIFGSTLIKNGIPIVVQTLLKELPVEFADFMVLDLDIWDENEFSALINATVILMKSNLLNATLDSTFNLNNETIEDLSRHLSSSKFLMSNMDGLTDYLLGSVDLGEGVEIGRFDNWSDQEEARVELSSLFQSINIIASSDLTDANAFLNLQDSELNTFLSSEIITNTLVNVIKAYSAPGNQLDFIEGVDNPDILWNDGDAVVSEFTRVGNIITMIPIEGVTKFHIFADGIFIGATRGITYDITEYSDAEITVEGFEEGELRKIFLSVGSLADNLLEGGSFSTDAITKLSDEEIENIVVSDVLVLSVISILEDFQESNRDFIKIPAGDLSSEFTDVKLASWMNGSKNSVTVEGELSKLLKGLRVLLDGMAIEDFSSNTITNLSDDKIYDILRSDVLAESMLMQIDKYGSDDTLPISIPETLNLEVAENRSKWMNVYPIDENGNNIYIDGIVQVSSDGEITKLLRALRLVFAGTNIADFDISVAYGENQNTLLKSDVISETIVQLIAKEANKPDSIIKIPSDLYLGDLNTANRNGWYNVYTGNELTQKGEISYLLEALELITNGGSFTDIKFDLSVAYGENQNKLLKSLVISETLVHQITNEASIGGLLELPSTIYLEDIDVKARDNWFNEYLDDELVKKGEIAYLLDAVELITAGSDFKGIQFDINVAFGSNQDILLHSTIISETIVRMINDQATNGKVLTLPDAVYLESYLDSNRELWYNKYIGDIVKKGEIAHFLDALDVFIGEGQTFETMNFSINDLFVPEKREVALKSTIFSETIVTKILSNTAAISSMPTVDLMNRPFDRIDNRDAWYNIYDDNDNLLEENEITKFLDSVSLLLNGNGYESLGSIDVDYILTLPFNISVNNMTYKVENSDFEILLDSLIVENIISGVAESIATGSLEYYLVVPGTGYNWLKSDVIVDYDISTYNSELYDLQSFLESLYLMDRAGINYKTLGSSDITSLNESNFDVIATSMVISRIFKGSISKMFNGILEPTFNLLPDYIPLDAPNISATKHLWEDVELKQIDYDGTNFEAHSNLVNKLIELNEKQIVSIFGETAELVKAYYNIE